ncbi:putative Late embryogenesis abundant protein, LEA_2 subgroup [Arabidopsis thaliana]
MASSKHEDYGIPYTPLPSSQPSQSVILLTPYRRHRRPSLLRNLRCSLLFTAVILLLSAAVYLLYPSDPDITVSRINLNHISVVDSHKIALDLSFSLTIKVRNRDFFSLDYDSLVVSIGYRGRELGLVKSKGGHLKARDSSYIDATLELDGLEVVHDVIYLIGDLAKGVIPFDTIAQVQGDLGVLLFNIPIQHRFLLRVVVVLTMNKHWCVLGIRLFMTSINSSRLIVVVVGSPFDGKVLL